MGLGEFGRMVHAEMAAIIDAARRGSSIDNQVLLTTTFPCQNCAKHILACGIRVVVYMEPYPKSLTGILHNEEVHLCALPKWSELDRVLQSSPSKLLVCSYIGIAPRRYQQLFTMGIRKAADGTVLSWKRDEARPRLYGGTISPEYMEREAAAIRPLRPYIK